MENKCILCKNPVELYRANGQKLNYNVDGNNVIALCPLCIRKLIVSYNRALSSQNLPANIKEQVIDSINAIVSIKLDEQ